MKILACVLLVLMGHLAFGQSLVHQEKMTGGQDFNSLDPMLDSDKNLIGLICSKGYSGSGIVVDRWFGPDTVIGDDYLYWMTANTIDTSGALHIYARGEGDLGPDHSLTTYFRIDSDTAINSSLGLDLFGDCNPLGGSCGGSKFKVRVVTTDAGEPLSVSTSSQVHTLFEVACFWTFTDVSTTYRWNQDLSSEIMREEYSDIVSGAFPTNDRNVWYDNGLTEHMHHCTEPPTLITTAAELGLSDPSGDVISQRVDSFVQYSLLTSEDFVPNVTGDEVVLLGSNRDTLNHPLDYFASCFSFLADSVEQVWRMSVQRMDPALIWKNSTQIIGLADSSHLLVYDYASQKGPGVVTLEHPLTAANIFFANASEESSEQAIYVAGRHVDTVFVYRFDVLTAIGEEQDHTLPASFTVSNPYPNPFNPSTSIDLALPANSRVMVKVLNLLGQQVAVIADRGLAAGNYTFTWDGSDARGQTAASGIYFFVIENAGNEVTRKMMLLK